jgi:hypothetical protein
VTYLKDIGWVLLIGLLLPLWMAIALLALVFVIGRHLYLWARGNTTVASRLARESPRSSRRASAVPRDREADRVPASRSIAPETAPEPHRP